MEKDQVFQPVPGWAYFVQLLVHRVTQMKPCAHTERGHSVTVLLLVLSSVLLQMALGQLMHGRTVQISFDDVALWYLDSMDDCAPVPTLEALQS